MMEYQEFLTTSINSFCDHVCIYKGAAIELKDIDIRLIGYLKRGIGSGADISDITGLPKSSINHYLKSLRMRLNAKSNIEILANLSKCQFYPFYDFKRR